MDDNGREHGHNKPPHQSQWLMQHQPSMKHIMAIMAERDAAIQERNLAISEKKSALAERDMAILHRDTAIAERNNAVMERDNAIATLHYCENAMHNNDMSPCPPGCHVARGVKHVHPPDHQHPPHMIETPTNPSPISPMTSEPPKARNSKRPKETKPSPTPKKSSKKVKIENDERNKKPQAWKSGSDAGNGSLVVLKSDWKDQDLGLNLVSFDDTTMPVPVCSCTGVMRSCYKWGNGGWQSSCCTTNLSMYPLPNMPNKRHGRIGGRKMSGSAFNKLLSRLAAQGHDLTNPVDLREHWAKHGTNRYITIK